MDEQRYREILPAAYMAAALEKGGIPGYCWYVSDYN